MIIAHPKSRSLTGLLPLNSASLASGEGAALTDMHGCNVAGKVKRSHARNFTKVFPHFAKGYKTHLKISVPKVPFKIAVIKY